jgi:L-threonylcarbamoyladenylate synthase
MLRLVDKMKTKIVQVDASSPDEKILEQAVKLLIKGELVTCPTDTGYALCANALNTRAIAKVFHLKARPFSNPIHIAVHSLDEAEKYATFNEAARYLATHYLPGALTIVLPKKDIVPAILVAGLNAVGIRIPDNKIILRLAEMTGLPLTATSANISSKPGTYSIDEVKTQFGENLQQVAMVLDQGPMKMREVSTIVDLSVVPPQLIRQGRIGWVKIHEDIAMFYHPKEEE